MLREYRSIYSLKYQRPPSDGANNMNFEAPHVSHSLPG